MNGKKNYLAHGAVRAEEFELVVAMSDLAGSDKETESGTSYIKVVAGPLTSSGS